MYEITWEAYHQMVRSLDRMLQVKYGAEEKIYLLGIPRGGNIIALLLSYINPELYEAQSADNGTLRFPKGATVIMVDDVLETGKTRTHYQNFWRGAPLAVLFDKSSLYKIPPANMKLETMTEKVWIKFPYEFLTEDELASMKEHGGYELKEDDERSC